MTEPDDTAGARRASVDAEVLATAEAAIPDAGDPAALLSEGVEIGSPEWGRAVHGFFEASRDLILRANAEHGGEEAAVLDRYYDAVMALQLLRMLSRAIAAAHEGSMATSTERPPDWQARALRLLYWSGFLISGEITVLLRSGYSNGAHARWRALHEATARAELIAQGGADVAQAYLLHEHMKWLNSRREVRGILRHHHQDMAGIITKEESRRDRETEAAVRELYGPTFSGDQGWAHDYIYESNASYRAHYDEGERPRGPRFSDLTRAISDERQHNANTELAYNSACAAVHGSPRMVFDLREPGEFLQGPSPLGLSDAACSTCVQLSRLTKAHVASAATDVRMNRLTTLLRGLSGMSITMWQGADTISSEVLERILDHRAEFRE
jgi:hypothetical protein